MDGNSKEAVANYRTSSEILKKAGIDPDDALSRTDAATADGLLGQALAQGGDKAGGLALLNRAIVMLDKRSGARSQACRKQPRTRAPLCVAWPDSRADGNTDGALADFRKTSSIFGAITASDPNDADTGINPAAADAKIGDALRPEGKSRHRDGNLSQGAGCHRTFRALRPAQCAGAVHTRRHLQRHGDDLQRQAMQTGIAASSRGKIGAKPARGFRRVSTNRRQVRNTGTGQSRRL